MQDVPFGASNEFLAAEASLQLQGHGCPFSPRTGACICREAASHRNVALACFGGGSHSSTRSQDRGSTLDKGRTLWNVNWGSSGKGWQDFLRGASAKFPDEDTSLQLWAPVPGEWRRGGSHALAAAEKWLQSGIQRWLWEWRIITALPQAASTEGPGAQVRGRTCRVLPTWSGMWNTVLAPTP